jgi:hypothetical protein
MGVAGIFCDVEFGGCSDCTGPIGHKGQSAFDSLAVDQLGKPIHVSVFLIWIENANGGLGPTVDRSLATERGMRRDRQ